MNDDVFNMSIRKYLKKIGINSQREIEQAVRQALEDGRLTGSETLAVKVTLELPEIDLCESIEGTIALE